MSEPTQQIEQLSQSLEDYLETVFELVRDHKLARVKDIAKARKVRSASVIPALRRLADMGLIEYEKREYIDLTAKGEVVARRVYARHRVLTRFFKDILGMPEEVAVQDACAMEHSLSDEGMDHMVRFLEFVRACPEGSRIIDRFRSCALLHDNMECSAECQLPQSVRRILRARTCTLADIKVGQRAVVTRVEGRQSGIRQRILDMGLLPGVEFVLERAALSGDPLWIRFQGSRLSLRKAEAAMVVVEVVE